MTVADLLADPSRFLHRIDPVAGEATFLPTTRALLTAPSFIDGRTDFANGPAMVVPLDALLREDLPETPGPNRMIFHVAFCGSTLLARMLDHEGAALVLKEPNVLVDLANWKRAGADGRFGPALRMATACLRRRWSAGEAVVVKPTNWINNLIGDLAAEPAGLSPVFVTMDPRAYAIAVLRGGRDRLTFAARTAAHLAPSLPEGNGWLQAAIAATGDPIRRTMNLALAALRLQERLLEGVGGLTLTAEEIIAAPADTALRASAALALDLQTIDPQRAAINAKRPGHAFSTSEREGEDADVLRHHGPTIDAALRWAEGALC